MRRWFWWLAAALAVVLAGVVAGVVVLRDGEEPVVQATPTGPALGVFLSTSPSDVERFGDWLGRDVDYVIDFSMRRTWDDIAEPDYWLETWQDTGYRMVYGLAMLPEDEKLDVSLAAGAQGRYNRYFRQLAENLVAHGQGDAILRLGWEFNLGAWRWHPGDAEDFTGYWRQVVTTMRAVPGAQNLEFDWNVSNGGSRYDSTRFYPGDDYVDYVGVDVYDISWSKGTYPYPAECDAACRLKRQKAAWNSTMNAKFGLAFWSAFARSRGKPLTLPEWGLWDRPDGHGGGDDPYFVERMHDFITDPANNVAYQAYFEFDVGASGDHRLSQMTESGTIFKQLFG
ncbi:hypothetical protein KIH74_25075 [Kineosporia sp. J2-2]|uniref:GH26 domain-containing protein n=1 Tax=Kineosporia corallincola TaxID=2835133 RepID=A0ABS5TMB3_9ACTN|nr:glycosyl hydrolase [Kineosporia corallincola]MBT0772242.1 hypothetical protein [Kineosporia corallincola]